MLWIFEIGLVGVSKLVQSRMFMLRIENQPWKLLCMASVLRSSEPLLVVYPFRAPHQISIILGLFKTLPSYYTYYDCKSLRAHLLRYMAKLSPSRFQCPKSTYWWEVGTMRGPLTPERPWDLKRTTQNRIKTFFDHE